MILLIRDVQTFSIKDKIVNILISAGQIVSVTIHSTLFSEKAARDITVTVVVV
jgi:hypothetical protein